MGLMDDMKAAASQAMSQVKADVGAARAADQPEAYVPTDRPIMEIVSHIEGKNAKVRLYPDRLEWERPRGLSAGKLTAGVLTGGASLLVTGVKGGGDEVDMVWLKHVTNVGSRKDGLLYYAVDVQASSGAAINTVSFRVNRDEAAQFRAAIMNAVAALEAQASQPTQVFVQAPVTAPTQPTPTSPDAMAQLRQLGELRDAGILTDAEFETKKADILSRM